eukprot:5907150-Pleurochrysis_carterae.AAC.1
MEQATEKFTFISDPARRPAAAAAHREALPGLPDAEGLRQPKARQAPTHVRHEQGGDLLQC